MNLESTRILKPTPSSSTRPLDEPVNILFTADFGEQGDPPGADWSDGSGYPTSDGDQPPASPTTNHALPGPIDVHETQLGQYHHHLVSDAN